MAADTLEFQALSPDTRPEAAWLAVDQLGSFVPDELELLLDPRMADTKKIGFMLDVYDSSEPRYGDFKKFAEDHYDVDQSGPEPFDPSTQLMSGYARVMRAINEYAPLQQRVDTTFNDPKFARSVSDIEWNELVSLDPYKRGEVTGNLRYRFDFHTEVATKLKRDIDFMAWAERVAQPEEQAALRDENVLQECQALTDLHAEYEAELRAAEQLAQQQAALEARQLARQEQRRKLAEAMRLAKQSLIKTDPLTEAPEIKSDEPEVGTAPTAEPEVEAEAEPVEALNFIAPSDNANDRLNEKTARRRVSRRTLGTVFAVGATAFAVSHGVNTSIDTPASTTYGQPNSTRLTLQTKAPHHNKRLKQPRGSKIKIVNPRENLASILAGDSVTESGRPAKPYIRNPYGYFGPWQMSPHYWRTGWANTYLGNPKAPMSLDNMTMAAVKMWKDNMTKLGSAEAAEATWLKGPGVGQAIAGRNTGDFRRAMQSADGNGTTVKKYTTKINHNIKDINVSKQLPWLKAVKKRHPEFNWSLLDQKYPLYSKQHMHQLYEHARDVRDSRARRQAGRDIAAAARHEFALNGNKILETQGPNTGPQVQKYTGGPKGPEAKWCAWFVSYVYRSAGYELKGKPASSTGNIASVANLGRWFDNHGIHFKANSQNFHPRLGDVVMYGRTEHTGVVTRVKGNVIDTIEGNTSGDNRLTANGNTVGRKIYNYKNSSASIEFGRLGDPQRR